MCEVKFAKIVSLTPSGLAKVSSQFVLEGAGKVTYSLAHESEAFSKGGLLLALFVKTMCTKSTLPKIHMEHPELSPFAPAALANVLVHIAFSPGSTLRELFLILHVPAPRYFSVLGETSKGARKKAVSLAANAAYLYACRALFYLHAVHFVQR